MLEEPRVGRELEVDEGCSVEPPLLVVVVLEPDEGWLWVVVLEPDEGWLWEVVVVPLPSEPDGG